MNMKELSIISVYVSHDSYEYIKKFSDRHKEELGESVYLINSSLNDVEPEEFQDFKVINLGENLGFSAANNIGIKLGTRFDPDYILIINPDVYLPTAWLSRVLKVVRQFDKSDVGIFTVPLIAYDFSADRKRDVLDGVGIAQNWYGRWFDVSQGEGLNVLNKSLPPYELQAACGALMLIHKDVVSELLKSDGYVFNESYFMYKEDIELSIRTRKLGKKIIMIPSEPVFHCRGWEKSRASSPYWARLLSAKNELKMHLKFHKCFLPYSALKYFYVRFLERVGFKTLALFK
jgi:GT2 family glycosyltransferase